MFESLFGQPTLGLERGHAAEAGSCDGLAKDLIGDITFVHPKDMGGILTEIMETPKEAH